MPRIELFYLRYLRDIYITVHMRAKYIQGLRLWRLKRAHEALLWNMKSSEALLWSYLATHVISAQFTSLTDLDVHGFRCIIPLNNFFHSILSRLSWRAVNITAMKATSHLKIEISVCWRVLAFRNIQHIPNARRLTRNNTMERRRKMCYRDIRPDNCDLWSFKIRQGSRDMFHFLWTIDHSLHSYFWWRVTNEVNRTGYSTDDGLTLIRQGFGGEKGKIYHGC